MAGPETAERPAKPAYSPIYSRFLRRYAAAPRLRLDAPHSIFSRASRRRGRFSEGGMALASHPI
jgi:hypothetical protein